MSYLSLLSYAQEHGSLIESTRQRPSPPGEAGGCQGLSKKISMSCSKSTAGIKITFSVLAIGAVLAAVPLITIVLAVSVAVTSKPVSGGFYCSSHIDLEE